MKKKQAIKIFKLLRKWTALVIVARHGKFRDMTFAQAAVEAIEVEDKIREELYGNANLVELGYEWGLLSDRKHEGRRRNVKKKKKNRSPVG